MSRASALFKALTELTQELTSLVKLLKKDLEEERRR